MSDPHGASDPPSGENPLAAEKDNVEATQNQLDTFLLLNPFEQAKKVRFLDDDPPVFIF